MQEIDDHYFDLEPWEVHGDAGLDLLEPDWVDVDGVRHIYVWDQSNYVEWKLKNGKLVKVYDRDEKPF